MFNIKKIRNKALIFIYIGISVLVLFNYFYLQVINQKKYAILAGNNSVRPIRTFPPRGVIYDRNYFPLVDNRPLYDMKMISHDITNEINYKLLEKHTGVNKNNIDSVISLSYKIPGGKFKPLLLKRSINFQTKAILEESKLDLNGIYFSELPARVYTSNCQLTHVLGYLRQIDKDKLYNSDYQINDIIGYSGIEKVYESDLKGTFGVDYFLVDRLGIIQDRFQSDNDLSPVQGENVILTINSNIQKYVEDSIVDFKGAVIIMDPKNGEIISLASSPNYNLSSFIGPIPISTWKKLTGDSDKPFTNRAIQQTFPPGSIFKLVLAAMSLENKIINKSWKVDCTGKYDFHNTTFRCWKEDGHGEVDLNDAIKKSCNIYFYHLMQKIDFNNWYSEITKFGFHSKTGIDLPDEKIGLIPNKKYMNRTYKNRGGWSKGHLLNLSIGQGEISVTPIQIINLINIIANRGKTFQPHLNLNFEAKEVMVNYNDKVWKDLREFMSNAVNSDGGTAYNAKINKKYGKVYGKTGTAQVCSNCDIEPHGWFAGFIELQNNKTYTICVIIENGGKGSIIPTKIAKNIFNYIINISNV